MDKATSYKMEATDLKNDGNYEAALEKYNLAVTTAPPSALLLANRGDVLLRLERYEASVRDCSAALEKNPDRYDYMMNLYYIFKYIYLYIFIDFPS